MSSILKALKRLEEENTARNPESMRINAEILRGNLRSNNKLVRNAVAAILLLSSGAGTMYLLVGKQSTVGNGQPTPTSPVRSLSGATVELPSNNAILTSNFISNRNPDLMHKSAIGQGTKINKDIQTIKLNSPVALNKAVTASTDTVKSAPVQAQGQIPTIRVDGIAYQMENSESVAVVNGNTVSNGSMIEGVRVVEIRKDRVSFSSGNEQFEVVLGKANR